MHLLAVILGKSALVVKHAVIDESANCQIKIVARKAGFFSWLFSLIGIDSTFTFRAYQDRLESEEGTLSGRLNTVIPLSALDTFTYGFTKPILYLVISIFTLILGLIYLSLDSTMGCLIFFVLSATFAIAYFLGKSLILNFTTNGTNRIFFKLKRSVIENVDVDEYFAKKVWSLVKKNYLAMIYA